MPRGLDNWTYRDIADFLRDHGFSFHEERKGSHEAWINAETNAIVELNFHGNNHAYPIRTIETMIRQSKIEKKRWRDWANK